MNDEAAALLSASAEAGTEPDPVIPSVEPEDIVPPEEDAFIELQGMEPVVDEEIGAAPAEAGQAEKTPVRVVYTIEPAEAEVTVWIPVPEEELRDPVEIPAEEDGSFLLFPGEYLYSVTCEGYQSLEEKELTVKAPELPEKATELRLTLELEEVEETEEAEGANAEETAADAEEPNVGNANNDKGVSESPADEETLSVSALGDAEGEQSEDNAGGANGAVDADDTNDAADDADISLQSSGELTDEELTELTAQMADALRLDREYLAIESSSDSVQLNLLGIPEELSDLVTVAWSTVDAEMNILEDGAAQVDDGGLVNAAPNAEGTVFVLAAVSLGDETWTARCRVDVTKKLILETVTGVSLADSKATVELYKTDYARVRVILAMPQNSTAQSLSGDAPQMDNTGVAITGAEFTDEATKAFFSLRVADDRTLEIVPVNAFTVEATGKITTPVKGSYKSAIKVVGEGWEATTPGTLSLTVKKTLPSVKAAVGKFNSFIPGDGKAISFTPAGAHIIAADTSKADWLDCDTGNGTLTLNANATGLKSASGKLGLTVRVDGWDDAIVRPVALSVSCARTAPKLSFKPATLTVNPAAGDGVTTLAAVSLAEYQDATIVFERITLNNKPYELGDLICSPEAENGVITVRASENFDAGTTKTFKIFYSVADEEASFTLKTLAAAKAVPSFTVRAAGTIDKSVTGSPVNVTVTPKNYSAAEYRTEYKQYDAKTNQETDVDSALFLEKWDGNSLQVTENPDQGLTDGTYRVYLRTTVAGVSLEKWAAFTVKTSDPAKVLPTVTLKATGKLDVIRPMSTVTVTPTFKNWYGHVLSADDLVFYRGTGKDAKEITDPAQNPFTVVAGEKDYSVTLSGSVNPKTEKFSVGMRDGSIPESSVLTRVPVALSVIMGSAKFTQSAKAVELLRYDRYSSAVLTVAAADATLAEIDRIELAENKTSLPFAVTPLDGTGYLIHYAGGDENPLPAKTKNAKLSLKVFLAGNLTTQPNATLSVTVNIVDTAEDTDITVTDGGHTITFTTNNHQRGTFSCIDENGSTVSRLNPGRQAKLVITPAAGYEVGSVVLINTSSNIGAYLDVPYRFVMPDDDIRIYVRFDDPTEILRNGACGANLSWTLYGNRTLKITGTGAMTDYPNKESSPWYREAIKKLVLEDGITSIGDYAFHTQSQLQSVSIVSTVTRIGKNAFSYSNIEDLRLPYGLEIIGEEAFNGCKFRELYIPDSVTTLGWWAFANCSNLTSVNYPLSLVSTPYKSDDTFGSMGGQMGGCFAHSAVTSITVPEGVTRLADGIFEYMYDLREVRLPSTLEEIGRYAFLWCEALTEVAVPSGVKTLGERAFYQCKGLRTVHLNEGLLEIQDQAFEGCATLEHVRLPDSVTTLGSGLFMECAGLHEFNYPRNLNAIGEKSTFSYLSPWSSCPNVTDMVVPDGVTEIPANTFSYCSALETVSLPDSVRKIGDSAFWDCPALTGITLPDGLVELGNAVFEECTSLSHINYPVSLEVTGGSIFRDCSSLEHIEVPEGVTYISSNAFYSANYLETISLPSSLTSFWLSNLFQCEALKIIYYAGSEEEWAVLLSNNHYSVNDIPDNVEVVCNSRSSEPRFSANFQVEDGRKTLMIGETWTVDADVSVTGGSGKLGRVTVNAVYYDNSAMTVDFSPYSVSSASLSGYDTFIIDTTKEPWNVPGTYNLRIWAKDTNGTGGDHPLTSMTLTITDRSAVSGKVLDSEGKAVSDAFICLLDESGSEYDRTTTNADGSWQLTDVKLYRNYTVYCESITSVFAPYSFYVDQLAVTVPDLVGNISEGFIYPNLTQLKVGAEGGEYSCNVISESSWTVSVNCDWITVSDMEGEGSKSITIAVSANTEEDIVRTGLVTFSTQQMQYLLPVGQRGTTAYRLGTPTVLTPAENEVVEYGALNLTWAEVDNADYYIVSLRDLKNDTLIVNHSVRSTDGALSTLLTPEYFVYGCQYRVAVGAVPEGFQSTDSFTGWSERIFSISPEPVAEETWLCGRITDESSGTALPVSGAVIRLYMSEESTDDTEENVEENTPEVLATVYSEDDGTWVFNNLTPGNVYTVTVSADSSMAPQGNSTSGTSGAVPVARAEVTTKQGENNVGDLNIGKTSSSIEGLPKGLWAKYYQFEDKNNAFTDDNLRYIKEVSKVDAWFIQEDEVSQTAFGPNKDSLTLYKQVKQQSYDKKGTADVAALFLTTQKMAVEYTGYITIPAYGEVDLRLHGDDGVCIILNALHDDTEGVCLKNGSKNNTVKESAWKDQFGFFDNAKTINLNLSTQKTYRLILQYYNNGNDDGNACVRFDYRYKNGKKWTDWTVVPESWFNRDMTIIIHPTIDFWDVRDECDRIEQNIKGFADAKVGEIVTGIMQDNVVGGLRGYLTDAVRKGEIKGQNVKFFANLSNTGFGKTVTDEIAKAFGLKVAGKSREDILKALKKDLLKKAKMSETDAGLELDIDLEDTVNTAVKLLTFAEDHCPTEYKKVKKALDEILFYEIDPYTGAYDKTDPAGDSFTLSDFIGFFSSTYKRAKQLYDLYDNTVQAAKEYADSDRIKSFLWLNEWNNEHNGVSQPPRVATMLNQTKTVNLSSGNINDQQDYAGASHKPYEYKIKSLENGSLVDNFHDGIRRLTGTAPMKAVYEQLLYDVMDAAWDKIDDFV